MNNQKKRILFHFPVPIKPEDYDGTQGRILAMLKYFNDRKDRFSIDAIVGNKFGNPEWTLERQQMLLDYVDNVLVYKGENNWLDFLYTRSQSLYHQHLLKQQLPVDSDYFAPPGYVQFLRKIVSQNTYDFVWINNLDYAHLATGLRKRHSVPILMDIHDITSQFRLVRKNIDYAKNLRFDFEANFKKEITLLSQFDFVIVDSQRERDIVSRHLRSQKLHFIPTPPNTLPLNASSTPYADRSFEYDILFVGAINQPNKDGLEFFLNSIFPAILQARPETRCAIAGKISSTISIDSALGDSVQRLGYVPDLPELYFKSRLVICPLISGAGTKFKLVEAMAYSMPIVTTEICAAALSLVDGVNAFIADDPALFAQKVLYLLDQPALCQAFSESISSVFKSQHSPESVYLNLDKIFGFVSVDSPKFLPLDRATSV
ncbi:glycosyltransferase [Phormidesmis sp. 146-35]